MKIKTWSKLTPAQRKAFVAAFMSEEADGSAMVLGRSDIESDYLESLTPFTVSTIVFNKKEHLVISPEYAGPFPTKKEMKEYEHKGHFNPVIMPLDIKVTY